MKKDFDVFVIGSGTAGQTVAKACANDGLKVAITDRREYGGTCSNRGCDPKKVLIGIAESVESSSNLKGKGLDRSAKPNWGQAQKFLKKFTKGIPKQTEKNLTELGITLFHQSPKFIDASTIEVEGKKYTAEKFVIASGMEPVPLEIPGANLLLESDDFLKLKKLPKKMTFIGAGYIGIEFAQIAHVFGAKVTIIETGERPLTNFDADMVEALVSKLKKSGIDFIFNAEVKGLKKLKKNIKVRYTKNGKRKSIKAKAVFNTAGRRPSIGMLNLDVAGVPYNNDGVIINSNFQSTGNKAVFACGDVSDHSLPLTPLSGIEGKAVATVILKGNQKKLKLAVVPSVVFSMPNIAAVGLSEETARSRYKEVGVVSEIVPDWYNAKRLNEKMYAYKVIVNKRTDVLVGAHLVGPIAAETINMFAMAINAKMKATDFKSSIFTYPSFTNDLKAMLP